MIEADPLERRLVRTAAPQARIDRLVVLATLHRIEIFENGYVVEPIGKLVASNKDRWRELAHYAQRLGLYSFLPWWARFGLDCERVFNQLKSFV